MTENTEATDQTGAPETPADRPGALRPGKGPPILPGSGWTAPLAGVTTAAMAFLMVLALAAAMAADRLADTWRADLAGVATVRVSAGSGDMDDRIKTVLEVLRTTPGISRVRVLDDAEQAELIAPWFGEGVDLSALPTPRLIDVSIDGAGPDKAALQARLDLSVSGVLYDDHAAWRGPLASATRSLEWLALACAVLIVLTTGCVIAFAARATLTGNRHVVETVRLLGAEDRFIANAFVWRLMRRTMLGGGIGAGLACLVLALFPSAPEGEAGLGISLAPSELGWGMLLLGVPCICAGFAWIAARTAVQVTLRRMP